MIVVGMVYLSSVLLSCMSSKLVVSKNLFPILFNSELHTCILELPIHHGSQGHMKANFEGSCPTWVICLEMYMGLSSLWFVGYEVHVEQSIYVKFIYLLSLV